MNALNPVRRVGDQIAEPIEIRLGQSRDASAKRARELLDLVGIPKQRAGAYPHELSGGMRQRAMIAMALACDPAIVIGDEPTTALDVMVQAQILQLLEQLRRDLGLSLMLITHDLSVIAETCDRVMVMYAGKVAEEGPVSRVFTAPRHPYTRKLLSAFPNIHADRRTLDVIPGAPPGPAQPAAGLPVRARAARSRWTSAARSSRPRSGSPTASASRATCSRRPDTVTLVEAAGPTAPLIVGRAADGAHEAAPGHPRRADRRGGGGRAGDPRGRERADVGDELEPTRSRRATTSAPSGTTTASGRTTMARTGTRRRLPLRTRPRTTADPARPAHRRTSTPRARRPSRCRPMRRRSSGSRASRSTSRSAAGCWTRSPAAARASCGRSTASTSRSARARSSRSSGSPGRARRRPAGSS